MHTAWRDTDALGSCSTPLLRLPVDGSWTGLVQHYGFNMFETLVRSAAGHRSGVFSISVELRAWHLVERAVE